ncbi:alpha/beta hydrolase-fold protein [Psychroserpens sp. SPM9]|uniref:alpha/beta hydrolase-fold protein n=1 Tax=Psychroserpens sp. SPM9 TaxID=2975598 RepID=UPI0021A679BA|nr:alpha/beta hydrolase-fold protein [Psychroserpens sp. SPM9]MDG5491787.1 alpha/beta hydrolase-fold protein [Psychroserpens sp. SPM9]
MKIHKLIIVLVVLCFCIESKAQDKQIDVKEIVIGKVDSIYSDILKEQREIWVSVPKAFNGDKNYPVIYVLDASRNFYSITAILKQLTPLTIPESIVVGILNIDRTRDFTPTNVPFQRGHKSETSGGASNFINFMNQELKPFINKKYPTENNSTIIGHSTGGLFVLYAFLNHQDVFDNYLAIDPSLWWDKEQLVNETQKLLDEGNRKEKSLYVAAANSIGKGLDTVKVRKDKSEPTEQIRANLKFHDVLVKNRNKLNYNWQYFKDEDHGSIVIPAQYNGLRALFSWFPFPEMWRFNTPKKYSAKELTDPYYAHYKKLSAKMKREVKPDWALINDVGFYMLDGHNLPEKALAYLEMNLDFYPNESKTYVALGKYYLTQKDKLVAISYFEKAIEIDNNQEALVQLKKLSD